MKLLSRCVKSLLMVSIVEIFLVLSAYPLRAQNQGEVPIPRPDFFALTQQSNAIVIGQTRSVSSRLSTNQYGDRDYR